MATMTRSSAAATDHPKLQNIRTLYLTHTPTTQLGRLWRQEMPQQPLVLDAENTDEKMQD